MATVQSWVNICDECGKIQAAYDTQIEAEDALVSARAGWYIIQRDYETRMTACSAECAHAVIDAADAEAERWRKQREEARTSIQNRREKQKKQTLKSRDNAWKLALKVACPVCKTGPGLVCVNLNAYANDKSIVPTSWPHLQRVQIGREIERSA